MPKPPVRVNAACAVLMMTCAAPVVVTNFSRSRRTAGPTCSAGFAFAEQQPDGLGEPS
jgi:hypothetical protein